MKGFFVALCIFMCLAILAVVIFRLNFYDIHVRYRLTVEVQDDDQVKTGSSVIDVSYRIEPDRTANLGGPDTHPRSVGYAPTVDLGGKGMLFLTFLDATRTPAQMIERNKQFFCPLDDIGCLPLSAYALPGTGVGLAYSEQKTALDHLLRQSGPRDVSFAVLPKLIRFQNIDDPQTRVSVSPEDLAASFGPGVELKRVILQLTDDPVTPPPAMWPQWLTIKHQNTAFRGYEHD